jgi:hypothetical protein
VVVPGGTKHCVPWFVEQRDASGNLQHPLGPFGSQSDAEKFVAVPPGDPGAGLDPALRRLAVDNIMRRRVVFKEFG